MSAVEVYVNACYVVRKIKIELFFRYLHVVTVHHSLYPKTLPLCTTRGRDSTISTVVYCVVTGNRAKRYRPPSYFRGNSSVIIQFHTKSQTVILFSIFQNIRYSDFNEYLIEIPEMLISAETDLTLCQVKTKP